MASMLRKLNIAAPLDSANGHRSNGRHRKLRRCAARAGELDKRGPIAAIRPGMAAAVAD
jgi:hypothetical protein